MAGATSGVFDTMCMTTSTVLEKDVTRIRDNEMHFHIWSSITSLFFRLVEVHFPQTLMHLGEPQL